MFESLLQGVIGGADGIQERRDGVAFLRVAKSVYPLTTTSYLGLNIPIGTDRKRFAQCMYSDQWVKQCVSREAVGPGRLAGLALVLPSSQDWSELPDTPDTQKLLALARGPDGHDAGRQVLSIPLRPLVGETALLFVGTDMPLDDWQAQRTTILREFQVLANYFHQHILRIYGHDAESQMIVSARELDCLKWVAAGKTAWEASVILGISERTVRFHLNAAREKLNCLTTTQAVAKAVSQQLIEAT
jgi:DNA-binding CsgD family transcriptional regulator